MKKSFSIVLFISILGVTLVFLGNQSCALAAEQAVVENVSADSVDEAEVMMASDAIEQSDELEGAGSEEQGKKSTMITLDFKEADIRDVLRIIAYKSGVNIVPSPEVVGTVNVRISNVPWEKALDVILKTYGFAYDRQDEIIMVAPLEKLTAQRQMEHDLSQVQPTRTEVVRLKFIDAIDAQKSIQTQLSARGKVTVLEITGQAGWGFGGTFSEKRGRLGETKNRSKVLIVTDIPPVLEQIMEVLSAIDIKPYQILIETRIVEVNLDKLKDFGFDYATGGSGSASSSTVTTDDVSGNHAAGANFLGNIVTPSAFGPKASAMTTANTGMQLVFQKLTGTRYEVIFHALEETVLSNTLSAPSILTLDNQEATILVGEQFPIVSASKSSDTSTTVDVSLEEYKDIGIQLNVVPQVCGDNKDYINMIIHPSVTTEGTLIENRYPRINTREAQTQVLIKTGETVVIGGLMKNVKNESVQGVPLLRSIPIFGKLFERKTFDTEKVELLIFITAHIVDDKSLTSDQIADLESKLGLE